MSPDILARFKHILYLKIAIQQLKTKWQTLHVARKFARALLPVFLISMFVLERASSQDAVAQSEQFSQRVWQARDGLANSAVQALTQTPDGYLWIGTSSGLVRFDGTRFVLFSHAIEKAFTDDSVWALAVGPDGTLWIGTEGGGLVRFRGGTFRRFATADGLSNLFVRAIYARSDGSLWVGTDKGLFESQTASNNDCHFHRVDATAGLPAMNVYTIHEGRNGILYVGGSGILELNSNGAHAFLHKRGNSEDGVVGAVQVSRNGTLWIGTQASLRAFEPRRQHNNLIAAFNPFENTYRVSIPNAPDSRFNTGQQKHLHVSVLTESRDGSLWIGTYGEGLLRWKDGHFRWFRTPEYLPDNHISAIFEDAQDDIWIGTPSGLTRLKHTNATSVRLADGTPVDISTISNGESGNMFLASLEGKMFQSSGAILSPASVVGLPADLAVRTTFRDRAGVLWIGTSGQGLYSVTNGIATHYSSPDFVRAFAQSSKGVLWVGTDGPLWSNSTGHFRTLDGNNKTSYRALIFDQRGILWAGSDSGLERIADGKLLHDESLAPLDMTKVWSLLADRDDNVWVGSRGSGLYLWRKGHLKHYAVTSGFPGESIFSIIQDTHDQIWISSSEGVWSIKREALIDAADSGNFGSSAHFYGDAAFSVGAQMSGGVQPAGAVTPAGDLWFAATDGALRIQPTLASPSKPFPLVIEQIRRDGEPVSIRSPVHIPANFQQIEIDYSAIRLDSPDQTRFRYRLDGLESHWTEADIRRAAFYTHIPAGTYRFHVQAFDQGSPDRVINAEIPVTFEPHIYETAWFYAICGLFLLFVIASFFLLHRRRLHERFKAVLDERNRVAREMHDTVIQGCIGVSTLLEAAHNTEQTFPEKSRLLIERATIQNRNTIDEARHAVWKLRNEIDPAQQLPFGFLLSSLVADLRDETTTPISLEITEALPILAVDAGESLLNVVREAMLNATRHACATQIQLKASVGRRTLTLDIADNGRGFSPQLDNPLHYGIPGMRERVVDLGGQVSIVSKPNNGTTVRIIVPLKRLIYKLREVTT